MMFSLHLWNSLKQRAAHSETTGLTHDLNLLSSAIPPAESTLPLPLVWSVCRHVRCPRIVVICPKILIQCFRRQVRGLWGAAASTPAPWSPPDSSYHCGPPVCWQVSSCTTWWSFFAIGYDCTSWSERSVNDNFGLWPIYPSVVQRRWWPC